MQRGKIFSKDIALENPLFVASYSEIDNVFLNDPDRPAREDLTYENLRDRVEQTVWRGPPGIFYKRRRPKLEAD